MSQEHIKSITKHKALQCFIINHSGLCYNPQDINLETVTVDVNMLIGMFNLELNDYFASFATDHYIHILEWIKNDMPQHISEICVKMKKERESQVTLSMKDLGIKHVVDADFHFTRWLASNNNCKFDIIKQRYDYDGSFASMSLTSDQDFGLGMKVYKYITHINESMETVIKAISADKHILNTHKNAQFHSYQVADPSSSISKYASVGLSSKMSFGPLLSPRHYEFVLTSNASFNAHGKMTEYIGLFKTTDYDPEEKQSFISLKPVKCKVIGCRVLNPIDNNSCRYTEIIVGNVGGILNLSLITNTAAKMVGDRNLKSLLKSIKDIKGQPIPSITNNKIMQVLDCNCKSHSGIDIIPYLRTYAD